MGFTLKNNVLYSCLIIFILYFLIVLRTLEGGDKVFLQTSIILLVMVFVFVLALQLFKMSPELSMILSAFAGALTAGFGIPVRHIVEGTFTYLDIILTIVTATIFMNILEESKAMSYIVKSIVVKFYKQRLVLLILLMLVLLLPGALTGAGSASVLISGGIVAMVFHAMGIPMVNVTAIVFLGAALSVVAPPINIYAMIICGGVNMPYIGFFAPLLIPVLVLAFFTVIYLGWKGTPLELDAIIEKLPPVPAEMSGFKVYFPFVVLALLMVATRLLPHALPILGVPLIFIISSVVALLMVFLSGQKVNILFISKRTVKQLFPLIATLVAVGIFVQILTLTGVRGLFVITVLSLPIWLVYIGLSFVLPFGEAILLYGIAAVLGIPLIFLFNSLNLNPIIATVGIILICPLGDALPPTRIIGRLTVETVGYKESYTSFLQKCMVPWIVITVVGICMVIFANSFKFLLI